MIARLLLRRQLTQTKAARAEARAARQTAIRYLKLVMPQPTPVPTPNSLAWDVVLDSLIANAYQVQQETAHD
jgi:hypothetical protein